MVRKSKMNKVFVYWNLHKKCWSIRSQKTRKVIAHSSEVVLSDCEYKVSEAGRQRVIKEGRKNVHAGVIGYWLPGVINHDREWLPVVTYNPYYLKTFINKETKEPIHKSKFCFLLDNRLVKAL
jgi:hypothetical protein